MLKGIALFYSRLIFPSAVFSILLWLIVVLADDEFSMKGLGLSYICIVPLFHYFIYELMNPDVYYFYNNLGLSRVVLWIATVIISVAIGMIFIII